MYIYIHIRNILLCIIASLIAYSLPLWGRERLTLADIVDSRSFETVTAFLVVANALAIGIETNMQCEGQGQLNSNCIYQICSHAILRSTISSGADSVYDIESAPKVWTNDL